MNNSLKKQAALAAMHYVDSHRIIGVGTGSTVNYFIEALATIKHRLDGCVASSIATEKKLRKENIPVVALNSVDDLPIYIDGADEITRHGTMIKGGGGALTREKIIASVAREFICIVDETKLVPRLGSHPVAIEVIPMARSYVARKIVLLGGSPQYRDGFTTDNGNIILDIFNLPLQEARTMEEAINQIPGVVENGIFARRIANLMLVAGQRAVETYHVE